MILRNSFRGVERRFTGADSGVTPMSDNRQHAHQLIDRLPEAQLSGLVQFLETIVHPAATALRNAPLIEARTWLGIEEGQPE
jgi:hypothetical protein